MFAVALVLSACAASPPSQTPTTTAAELAGEARVAALARTCARLASCAHPHDPPRFRDPSTCVADLLEHAGAEAPTARCLLEADSCEAVAVCLHRQGDPRAAAYCEAHPGTKTACEGDALVACANDDPRESTLTACGPLGAVCGESHSAGGLVAHGCLTPSVCPPDVTRVKCDGATEILACHDEILERVACRAGTTCHPHKDEDGEEAATCEGPNEVSCSRVGERVCRGAWRVDCVAHGHHARDEAVDCSSLGLTCGGPRGKAACVSREGTACVPGSPRCEGGALVFCAAGRPARVSCAEVGLGDCDPAGNGRCGPAVASTPASPAR